MVDLREVIETNQMVSSENLDVRTITMGISLLDCMTPDLDDLCENIYAKITENAKDLVSVGDEIALEIGIPVINKRVSVTPAAIVGAPATARRTSWRSPRPSKGPPRRSGSTSSEGSPPSYRRV